MGSAGFKIMSSSEQQVSLRMCFFLDFLGFSAVGKGLSSPALPQTTSTSWGGAQGLCQGRAQQLPRSTASLS